MQALVVQQREATVYRLAPSCREVNSIVSDVEAILAVNKGKAAVCGRLGRNLLVPRRRKEGAPSPRLLGTVLLQQSE